MDQNNIFNDLIQLHKVLEALEKNDEIKALFCKSETKEVLDLLIRAKLLTSKCIAVIRSNQNRNVKMKRVLLVTRILGQIIDLLYRLKEFFLNCKLNFYKYTYEHCIKIR